MRLLIGAAGAAIATTLTVAASSMSGLGAADSQAGPAAPASAAAAELPTLVFVSRRINDNGSLYLPGAKDMPGVGPQPFRCGGAGQAVPSRAGRASHGADRWGEAHRSQP